jgi:DNA-binding beta-propeller fold protein YncE
MRDELKHVPSPQTPPALPATRSSALFDRKYETAAVFLYVFLSCRVRGLTMPRGKAAQVAEEEGDGSPAKKQRVEQDSEPAEESEGDDEDVDESEPEEEEGGSEGGSGAREDEYDSQEEEDDGMGGFSFPDGVCVDSEGNVFVCDGGNHRIVQLGGDDLEILTYAGEGGVDGYEDGHADTCLFSSPTGLTVAPDGHLIIADQDNQAIRKVDSDTGEVTTAAGSTREGSKNGPALEAEFSGPMGVACDKKGNIFVVDAGNHQIRKFSPRSPAE